MRTMVENSCISCYDFAAIYFFELCSSNCRQVIPRFCAPVDGRKISQLLLHRRSFPFDSDILRPSNPVALCAFVCENESFVLKGWMERSHQSTGSSNNLLYERQLSSENIRAYLIVPWLVRARPFLEISLNSIIARITWRHWTERIPRLSNNCKATNKRDN